MTRGACCRRPSKSTSPRSSLRRGLRGSTGKMAPCSSFARMASASSLATTPSLEMEEEELHLLQPPDPSRSARLAAHAVPDAHASPEIWEALDDVRRPTHF